MAIMWYRYNIFVMDDTTAVDVGFGFTLGNIFAIGSTFLEICLGFMHTASIVEILVDI
jgi:hypothetical protein